MVKEFIKEVIRKAVDSYVENMSSEFEVNVEKQDDNFVNDTLSRSILERDTGGVEVEGGSHVPLSWSQVKSAVMEMIQTNNPVIMEAITHPQNTTFLRNIVGADDLYIPGEGSRNKQWFEIGLLLEQQPAAGPDGQPGPSVPTIPGVDNDAVELEICRVWLTSDKGIKAMTANPGGYENVKMHAMQHMMNIQQQQVGPPGPGGPPQGPGGPPPGPPGPPQ